MQERQEALKLPSDAVFMCLMAAIMALSALTIDIMLPALFVIAEDLAVPDPQQAHLIVTLVIIGMAFGQIVFGPLSDSQGRKPSMMLGLGIFCLGTVMVMLAPKFEWVLVGRVVQGIGLGAPRTVASAIMRDLYSDRRLASVFSTVQSIFILVPMFAPAMGQLILLAFPWKGIFVFLLLMGLLVGVWFFLQMPETLPPQKRQKFSADNFLGAVKDVLSNKVVLLYSIGAGFMFAAFLGYLTAAPNIFIDIYPTEKWFGAIFAFVAVALAIAAYVNGRLVMRIGMERLIYCGLITTIISSALYWLLVPLFGDVIPLAITIGYLLVAVFAQGLLFGNMTAMAMTPLHKNVGLGAMWIGFISSIVAVPGASFITHQVVDSPLPVALGFGGCSLVCLTLVVIATPKK